MDFWSWADGHEQWLNDIEDDIPLSRAGASHQIINRAPLCHYHDIQKSNHRLHLAECRETIADAAN